MRSHDEIDYRFFFRVDDGPKVEVFPTWGNKHERTRGPESGRKIIRDAITEAFLFQDDEVYRRVLGGNIEETYFLDIHERIPAPGRPLVTGERDPLFFPGEFHRTDAKVSLDNKTLRVSLRANDRAKRYLEESDTEIDLVGLGVPVHAVQFQVRPVLQIYARGATTVTDIVRGDPSESNVETITLGTPFVTLGFTDFKALQHGYLPRRADYPVDVSGYYEPRYDAPDIDTALAYRNVNGKFTLEAKFSPRRWEITNAGGEVVATADFSATGPNAFSDRNGTILDFAFTAAPSVKANFYYLSAVARWSVFEDTEFPTGTDSRPIAEGDQFALGSIYSATVAYTDELDFRAWEGTSETDQGFGRYPAGTGYRNAGKFISPPASTGWTKPIPIARNLWGAVSWWAYWRTDFEGRYSDEIDKTIRIPDAFRLTDVLAAMLKDVDPNISLEATAEYSELLFGAVNPLTNERPLDYYIAPKTHVLNYRYDTPANRAPLKIAQVEEFLRYAFQAETFLDESYRYRIEAEPYFLQGGTYRPEVDPLVAVDLVRLIERYTGRPWSSFTSSYEFEKERLPERITTRWADESSDIFQGTDLVSLSKYVKRGEKEERRVTVFSTDLRLAVTRPTLFATSGFFAFACYTNLTGDGVVVETDVPGYGPVQNGALAWPYLQDVYYRDNMPARRYLLNGEETIARTTRPTKVQEVSAPAPPSLAVDHLTKTEIGVGITTSVALNMATHFSKITLQHGDNK